MDSDFPCRRAPVVMVLRGLMGAGKSTLAAELARTSPDTGVVCRDTIREIHFHRQGLLPVEDEIVVTAIETRQALGHLCGGRNVIIDATNLEPDHVRRWQSLAAELRIACVVVDVRTSLEDCIANVARRHRAGGRWLDPQIIRDTHRRHPPELWTPPADLRFDPALPALRAPGETRPPGAVWTTDPGGVAEL